MTLSTRSMPSMRLVRARFVGRAIERARERSIQDLVDERGLARAAHARHGDEGAERKRDVDVLQVVGARAAHHELAARRLPARGRHLDSPRPDEILAGQRLARIAQELLRQALEDHSPAVLARARTEIDQEVRRADRLFVVFDDEHGVAEIAQLAERREQPAVVALVQADRRLVEHVQHAGQLRSDLRREPDALALAARERRRASAERQVADAHIGEEPQPLADLAHDAAGDEMLALGELDRFEDRQHLGDWQIDVVREPAILHAAPRGSLAAADRPRMPDTAAAHGTLRAAPDPSTCLRRTGGADWESRLRSRGRTDPSAPSPTWPAWQGRCWCRVCDGRERRRARCRAASSAACERAPRDRSRRRAAGPRASRRPCRCRPWPTARRRPR